MGMHRAARLAGPAAGVLVLFIGFLAGWAFATTLVASAAAVFATLVIVVLIRHRGRKDTEGE